MSTGNSTQPTRGQSAGAGLGNMVKGGFQTVQGLGNAIRGNAMDFVDSATGTGGRHTETDVGRAQTEQGIARMETGKHAPAAGAGTADTTPANPTVTSTAAPALPPRHQQGATTDGL